MVTGFITHKEATIRHFMEDPEFADYLMSEVFAEGNQNEIKRFQAWYNEAKSRSQAQSYWNSLKENVQNAVKNGYDLNPIFASLTDALNTVKAAMA